ncbi:MAG: hypothetical protein FK734_00970 [Asgard group archaeon]|nr:hypothetical protein [Asgard group archaeon]
MSSSSRDVKKRLFEFAKNEYETKSPEYTEVRKAKGTKTFYHGPIPQLILTRYKAIAYTVFVHYGTMARLYYFNRDGYCVSETSYSEDQLDKIIKHLEKTSTRVLRYPKIEVKPTISDHAVELDNRYSEIIEDIEKITKIKVQKRPIITINNQLDDNKNYWLQPFQIVEGFLEVPVNLKDNKYLQEILTKEAFFVVINSVINDDYLSRECARMASMLYLTNHSKLEELLLDWKVKKLAINKLNSDQANNKLELLKFFDYLKELKKLFFDSLLFGDKFSFTEKQISCFIDSFFNELYTEEDAKNKIANFITSLESDKEFNLIKEDYAIYLFIKAISEFQSNSIGLITDNTLKAANNIANSKPKGEVVDQLINAINNKQAKSFLSIWRSNINLFSTEFDYQIDEVLETIYYKGIDFIVEFTSTNFDTAGDIILTFINRLDSDLGSFTAEDLRWTPRDNIEIIGEKRKIKLASFKMNERYSLKIPILLKKKGTVNFNNLGIRFNDAFGYKQYLRLPIPSLKIE